MDDMATIEKVDEILDTLEAKMSVIQKSMEELMDVSVYTQLLSFSLQ